MTPELIVGSRSFERIVLLHEAYKRNRIRLVGNLLDGQNIEYSPVFGFEPLLNNVYSIDVKLLSFLDFNHLIESPIHELRKYIFRNLGGRECFFEDDEHIDILDSPPSSEDVSELMEAIQLINLSCSWIGNLFFLLIKDIWLVSKQGKYRFVGGGASHYQFVGIFTMSFRPQSKFQVIDLAISIAHELGHNVFYLCQFGQNPISMNSWNQWVYSGVRKVDRPSYAAFHASVALAYMLSVARGIAQLRGQDTETLNYLESKIDDYNSSLIEGIKALEYLDLNSVGKIVLNDLRSVVQ